MTYVVAYDIAHPRRLRRVARLLERRAVRCQKSVFLFHGDAAAVAALLDEVAPLLYLAEDCVQAWKLSKDQPAHGLRRGTTFPVCPAGAVLAAGKALFVEKRRP
jgi:CRISPR-associated endonuclease Cas2